MSGNKKQKEELKKIKEMVPEVMQAPVELVRGTPPTRSDIVALAAVHDSDQELVCVPKNISGRKRGHSFIPDAENAFGATGAAAEQHYSRMALGFKAQMQAGLRKLEAAERANNNAIYDHFVTSSTLRCGDEENNRTRVQKTIDFTMHSASTGTVANEHCTAGGAARCASRLRTSEWRSRPGR